VCVREREKGRERYILENNNEYLRIQVLKANTFINKLTTEMAEKEPEVAKLNAEIEQLNKRLSQVINFLDIQ
jgi:uncharacterized protein involved in exopolysaccharide biosynthesis